MQWVAKNRLAKFFQYWAARKQIAASTSVIKSPALRICPSDPKTNASASNSIDYGLTKRSSVTTAINHEYVFRKFESHAKLSSRIQSFNLYNTSFAYPELHDKTWKKLLSTYIKPYFVTWFTSCMRCSCSEKACRRPHLDYWANSVCAFYVKYRLSLEWFLGNAVEKRSKSSVYPIWSLLENDEEMFFKYC